MDSALAVHRLHFAFTIVFHYLFVQLTLGLSLLVFILKTLHLRTGSPAYSASARFWTRIFAINFAIGVVTGIPMEFQFGTNWSVFAASAGGVIGHTLAMEGVYAFFLESTFLGLLLFGERKLSPVLHWLASLMVLAGTWLSAFFIVATNSWMQHPVGYDIGPGGEIRLASFGAIITNPWLGWQILHTLLGGVMTGSAVMASVGAFYCLSRGHEEEGRIFVKTGVWSGLAAAALLLFPTGDGQGRMVALHQPATLAAMEGHFRTEEGAPLVIIGQPDPERMHLDNPIRVPKMLSFVTWQSWSAEVKGLDAFPRDEWPENIPLLYYAYHVMVGLGTIFVAVFALAAWRLRGGRVFRERPVLWLLMLMLPFPYIANTAGWMSAELGRQPWAIHGLMRTAGGVSPSVTAGNALFTLIGFMGMYTVLGILFLFLVRREIERGPSAVGAH